MKKLLIAILTAGLFICATSAMATSFYYEASDVFGIGEISYGVGAPEFLFTGLSGDVDTNMGSFVAGNYTVDITLTGFWADFNEDKVVDFGLPSLSGSVGPFDIAALPPLDGTYGALSWDFDPFSSLYLSYDFGYLGNMAVNGLLANLDPNSDGFMDAYIGWESFRVELNNIAPVPEPSTFILLGAGIAGLAFYRRKKS